MLLQAALAVLWVAQIHFAGDIHFTGDAGAGACPSAAEVEDAFVPIAAHDREPGGADDTVTVTRDRAGRAVIRFASDGADPFADRVLPAEMSCAERAKAAAVIVAAHLRRQAVAAERPTAPPQPEPESTLVPTLTVQMQTPTRAVAPARTARVEMEVGALAARGGSTWAPGVRGGFSYGLSARDRLGLGLGYVGTSRTEVAGGQAIWSRATVALQYARRMAAPGWGASFVDLGLDVRASRLGLGSEGFHQTETSTLFHPGFGAGVRGGHRLFGATGVWAGIDGVFWPRKQEVFLRDVPESTILPRWELVASVGASWSPR